MNRTTRAPVRPRKTPPEPADAELAAYDADALRRSLAAIEVLGRAYQEAWGMGLAAYAAAPYTDDASRDWPESWQSHQWLVGDVKDGLRRTLIPLILRLHGRPEQPTPEDVNWLPCGVLFDNFALIVHPYQDADEEPVLTLVERASLLDGTTRAKEVRR
jgi:hypothetical protein